MFFDSHCHLTDARFAGDADAAVERARAAGVAGIVTVASDAADAAAAAALARRHAGVWATAGVHPHAVGAAAEADFQRVLELAAAPDVVALGETGLDYHYDTAPRDVQRRWLRRHLEAAGELGLPLVVHSRAADEDTAAMLAEAAGRVPGVLHCFSGGAALLDAALAAGWCISFAGMVSFRNYDGGALVRAVPGDRLLAETDSPYLAPVPHRGRRNEPAFVPHVVAALAALRGEPAERVAAATTANAGRFYGVRPPVPGGP
jgi:TatD DNase family protein